MGRETLRPFSGESFLKHFTIYLAASVAIGGSAAMVLAQAAPPTAAEKKSATTLILPPAGSKALPAAPKNAAGGDKSSPAAPTALLPDAFSGWVQTAPAQPLADVTAADPVNAAALKEYGFTKGLAANYKRDGETLTLRALRFGDASGAYGAFTFYRQNGWPKQALGAGACSDNNRLLFWAGTTLVDANFSHVTPMSVAELREIASQLQDGAVQVPPVMANLPKDKLEGQTAHYALGPAGYAGAGGVLPPSLVAFDKGAEAVTANYSLPSGMATLTLIDYPTPQIAAAQETAIRDYLKAGSQAQPAWPKPLLDSDQASLEVRHSGPIVAIVSGDAVPTESHRLLESVHYEAEITSLPQQGMSDVEKTSKLLLGIAAIAMVGAAAAFLLGGFLGGGRALYRLARGKPVSSVYDEEFISLDLGKIWDEAPDAIQEPHPKG
jgi:hypothetical protein